MSASEQIHPPFWPRINVMDFLKFTESMHTGLSPDYPHSCLGASDLNFIINAPPDYSPAKNGALATLYFDHANCERKLPNNAYQVRCIRPLDTRAFMQWAEQGIGMIRDVLMHVGLVCIDLADLTSFLESCSSKKLILEIISYENPQEIPRSRLQGLSSKNIFAALFAGTELTMHMYLELGVVLEKLNPTANTLTLTANFTGNNANPSLMFLAELES